MHHSAANSHTCVNSWAPSHQTNSSMQKCPSGATYKYCFPNTPGFCRSLPYEHQGECLPQCSQQKLTKRTCHRNSWGKVGNSKHTCSSLPNSLRFRTALRTHQFNKLPNDHPQASEGPDKISALISTDQFHNCNINEAPQNSSSQNLTRKVKDWRDWTYTDGSL